MNVSTKIAYVAGDATRPIGEGSKVIAHICNDEGKWGKGFVLALSRRWKQPETQYRAWSRQTPRPQLGEVQFTEVEPKLWVANIIGQHGVKSATGAAPRRHSERHTRIVADGEPDTTTVLRMFPESSSAGLAPIRYSAVEQGLKTVAAFARLHSASVHMPRIGCGLAGGKWDEIEPIIARTLIQAQRARLLAANQKVTPA